MFRRHLSFLLVVAGLLSAAPAYAQSVRELNEQGLKAFAEGRYVDAAESFDQAYELEPKPELLKNEAVSWYKAERCKEAVESAHLFLTFPDTESAERIEISSLLGACKVKLAKDAIEAHSFELADRLLEEVEDSQPDDLLADRVARTRIALAKAREEFGEQAEETPAESGQTTAGDSTTVTEVGTVEPEPRNNGPGWALVGVGAASLVGAIVYHTVMATVVEPNFHSVAHEGTDRDRYDKLDRQLRTANVLVPTLYSVGAVSTVVGIVWVARSPAGGDSVALLGVSGTF
jgi:tetratricopeptide (TPR) repeat protein